MYKYFEQNTVAVFDEFITPAKPEDKLASEKFEIL